MNLWIKFFKEITSNYLKDLETSSSSSDENEDQNNRTENKNVELLKNESKSEEFIFDPNEEQIIIDSNRMFSNKE